MERGRHVKNVIKATSKRHNAYDFTLTKYCNIFLIFVYEKLIKNYGFSQINLNKTIDFGFKFTVVFADGVIVIDDDYLKDRKVFGQVVCSFRYGREEDEIMGLNFQKDLYLASEQLYPPPEKREENLTKLQVGREKRV